MAHVLLRGLRSVAGASSSMAPANLLHTACISLSRFLPDTGWARGFSTRKLPKIEPLRNQGGSADTQALDAAASGWQQGAASDARSIGECKQKRVRRPQHGGPPDADPSRALARIVQPATFGKADHFQYRKTFFDAYPDQVGKVVVHHAVEQRILNAFPGLVTKAEMHSLENLRGVPNGLDNDLHLSWIRRELNRFYKAHPNPTKQQLLDCATDIDRKYGHLFTPKVGE